jgi:hypothetical protein
MYYKDAENIYAPLMMVSVWGQKRTLADKTVYQNGSIDTAFETVTIPVESLF